MTGFMGAEMMRRLLRMAALGCLLLLGSRLAADQGERTDNAETVVASQLRGAWVAVSMESGGRKEEAPKNRELMLTFEGGKLSVLEGKHTEEGTYTIRDARTPNEIDMVPSRDLKGAPMLKGIYRIDGDTLKLAFSRGGPRPTAFESKDNNSVVIIFKRKN